MLTACSIAKFAGTVVTLPSALIVQDHTTMTV